MRFEFLTTVLIILVLFVVFNMFSKKSENFSHSNNGVKVILLVSSTCPHCQPVINNFDDIKSTLNNKGYDVVMHISSPDTQEIFQKYDAQYVPMCIVEKNSIPNKLDGQITVDNIEKFIQQLK
jgi:thiol-disulfide isomerase/thioredoxin